MSPLEITPDSPIVEGPVALNDLQSRVTVLESARGSRKVTASPPLSTCGRAGHSHLRRKRGQRDE